MTDKKLMMADKEFANGAYRALPSIEYRDAINELIKPYEAQRLMYSLSKQQLRDIMAAAMLMVDLKYGVIDYGEQTTRTGDIQEHTDGSGGTENAE